MVSQAKLAHGTQFKRSGTSVLEVTKIDGMEIATKDVDVTNTDSGGYVEKIPGIKEGKDVVIEGNFRPDDATGQMALQSDQGSGNVLTFSIVGPAALPFSWTWTGYVKNFSVNADVQGEKPTTFSATIAVSGQPVLSYTASSNLTALAVSVGSLVPGFSGAQKDYIDSLTAGTASVTITATNAAANLLQLYVNDALVQALTSGVASSAVATPVGNTRIRVLTQDSGKVPNWYTINLGRAS